MKKLKWEYNVSGTVLTAVDFHIKKGWGKLYELHHGGRFIGHFYKIRMAKQVAQLIHNG